MPTILERYIGSGHRQVEGWLSDLAIAIIVALERLQRDFRIAGPVCEIGVHHGRLFILLHLLTRPGELSVAFDLFEMQHENVDRSGLGNRERLQANLATHGGEPDRVRLVADNSLRLTTARVLEACHGRPRLFSVDGGHTQETTYNDLRLARSCLCEGGLLILDDYFHESFPGVSEGTCRFMRGGQPLHPVAIGGNKFVFTTARDSARAYREHLATQFANQVYRTTAFGEDVLIFRPLTRRQRLAQTRLWQSVRHTPVGRLLRLLVSR